MNAWGTPKMMVQRGFSAEFLIGLVYNCAQLRGAGSGMWLWRHRKQVWGVQGVSGTPPRKKPPSKPIHHTQKCGHHFHHVLVSLYLRHVCPVLQASTLHASCTYAPSEASLAAEPSPLGFRARRPWCWAGAKYEGTTCGYSWGEKYDSHVFFHPHKLGCTVTPIIGTATPSRNNYSMQSNYLSLSKWPLLFPRKPQNARGVLRENLSRPVCHTMRTFICPKWFLDGVCPLSLHTRRKRTSVVGTWGLFLLWNFQDSQRKETDDYFSGTFQQCKSPTQTASKKIVCNVTFQLKSVGSM